MSAHDNENRQQPKPALAENLYYTKTIWAGQRKYFLDILTTKKGEKYISITENRKVTNKNGESGFENQKVFLFKEDFKKFSEGLAAIIKLADEENSKISKE